MDSCRIIALLPAFANHLQVSRFLAKHLLRLRSQACCEFLIDLYGFSKSRLLGILVAEALLCHASIVVSAGRLERGRRSLLDLPLSHNGKRNTSVSSFEVSLKGRSENPLQQRRNAFVSGATMSVLNTWD